MAASTLPNSFRLPARSNHPHLYLVPNRRVLSFELPACEFEIPGFGPCDAQPCGRRAIASSISLQIPGCKSCLANLEAEAL